MNIETFLSANAAYLSAMGREKNDYVNQRLKIELILNALLLNCSRAFIFALQHGYNMALFLMHLAPCPPFQHRSAYRGNQPNRIGLPTGVGGEDITP